MRQRAALKLTLILLVCMLIPIAAEAAIISVQGFVLGDCNEGADVNITLLNVGTNQVNQTQLVTAGIGGGYGWGFNPNPDLDPPGDDTYDIAINATNAACSPSAFANHLEPTIASGAAIGAPVEVKINLTMNADFAGTTPSNSTYAMNETQFNWTNDYIGVNNFTLLVSTDPTFAAVDRTITDITGFGYQLTNAEELADDVYYWKVMAYNTTGTNIDNTTTLIFEVATGAALIINETPANGTWVSGVTQAVLLQTQLDAECRYDTAPGQAYTAMTPFTSTGTTNHSGTLNLAAEYTNTFYIKCNTSAGVINALDHEYALNRDTTPPSPAAANVSIDNDAATSSDTTLDFNWTGFTDGSGSGIASYYYSFSDNGGTTIGTNDATSPGQLAGSAQGFVDVYVWAVDNVGNIGAAASDAISVDSLPPAFESWSLTPVNLNKYWTGDFVVDLTLNDVIGINGTPSFRYRIGSDAWSSWINMTFQSNVGVFWNYQFTIPEAVSPSTWFERSAENLTYQARATDTFGRSNNITRDELIDDQVMPPDLDPLVDRIVDQNDELIVNLTAYDQDMETLIYTCNFSASITKTNNTFAVARWTPSNDDVGTYIVSCNVTDGVFIDTETFMVTVTNVNDNPVLEFIGTLYAQEYMYFNYTLNASDVDGDIIAYTSNSSIFSLNRLTGKIAFTPFPTQRGTYSLNFTIEDGNGGYDNEVVSFTIGYCGDNVCRGTYEDCTTCEIDCGVCGAEESQTILLEPRNCLDTPMTVQAVTLVTRATCEEEGRIIDGMEVCGGMDGATLQTYILRIEDEEETWEEGSRLVADDDGYVTFTPGEVGEYKIAFTSDTDIYELFEVKACVGGELPDDGGSTSPTESPTEVVTPPIVEEPTQVDELASRWNFFSILLYFFMIPLLLLALIITSLGYVYKIEQKKTKKTKLVKTVDGWIKEYNDYKKKMLTWMHKTTPFKELLIYLGQAKRELRKIWRFMKGLIIEYWFSLIIAIGMQRKVRLEYFDIKAPGKTMHLVLISLLKNLFPRRSVDEMLALVYEYSVQNLMDIAAMIMSFNVRVTYVDPQPANVNYLNSLMAKGLQFRNRAPTRIDVQSALREGRPVLAIVNELGEKNTLVQSMVIVYGFDKYNFYYHDYIHGRQGLHVTKDQFMHAWKAAGYKGLWVKLP